MIEHVLFEAMRSFRVSRELRLPPLSLRFNWKNKTRFNIMTPSRLKTECLFLE